ncbi:hypothetical protein EI94DRAFT_1724495 [Lactarius quietus]|nr:hypothetical protein EI94DRAFT_1724495 [Lactarius quietus]
MSFISVEPQSRVVLESHSNSLLSQFDTHLKIIGDRYLVFFQERRRIEATYIDSLRKLHLKATTVDASFDARFEPTNTRSAWDRVRDNLENEASTHQTFMDILDSDVIKPLKTLKETKDATRKRIKDDLKGSAAKYADHAENTISKLQQEYLKKYHPLEESPLTEVSQRPEDARNKRFGGKVSSLFRGRREDLREPELSRAAKSEEVSDDTCREVVYRLNELRWRRVEHLRDGYDCLEELVFMPTIQDVLAKYMDGMIATHAKYDDLEKSATAEVKKALAGTDTSDLRASFRRALSFSIPPLTLCRIYRPGAYSELIFGAPLVDDTTDDKNVPRVMRMCIEEVEKRGLDAKGIYPKHIEWSAELLKLRRRIESEKSFSFSSTDNIISVAALFTHYIWEIPEPLLVLSSEEYRHYTQHRARHASNDFSLLRSRIRELHPIHRASLGALLRHLSRVVSHSDKNAMTMKEITTRFSYAILRGNAFLQDSVHVKALVMEDLIQNVHTLFDEHPSQSSPVPSPDVVDTTPARTDGSLFLSPKLPQSVEVPAMSSTAQLRPGLVDGIPTSTQSSFSSLPLEAAIDSRLTPSPSGLLSPLVGLPSSQTLMEGVETATQAEVIPEVRGPKAAETLASDASVEVVSAPPTSVTEWRLRQSRLPPQLEALAIPQSPPESVLSNISDFPLSSATSLQTGMGGFSP